MKLHIKESSYIAKHYDYIKQCFESNDIHMNLLNHVDEVNHRFYIDTDLTEADNFNNDPKYCNEWRVEAETIESPYYEDYHFLLFHIVNNREFREACFMTIEEVFNYIEDFKHDEERYSMDW